MVLSIVDLHAPSSHPQCDPARPSTWAPARALLDPTTGRVLGDLPDGFLIGVATDAYVNHGRWVADCPLCPSAQVVDRGCPEMWCPQCEPGGWFTVVFPEDASAIEVVLDMRPRINNRNWVPGETVEDLVRENAERLE